MKLAAMASFSHQSNVTTVLAMTMTAVMRTALSNFVATAGSTFRWVKAVMTAIISTMMGVARFA